MISGRRAGRLGPVLLGALLAGAAASAGAASWEQPAALDAGTLLGRDAIAGPHHGIEPRVESDGLTARYTITSSYQRIGATGSSLALERAREQEAIAMLRKIKTSEAYAGGLAAASKAPLAVTRQALTDPVGVMKSVPGAVSNLWSDLSGAVGGLRRGSEQDRDAEQMLKELLGYQRVKGRLAAELDVDAYSSNAVLQEDLGDVSWAIFAGGASVDLAMSQAPVAAGLSLRAANAIDGARAPLWDIPPATLQQASADALREMGAASDDADALVWHPVCTLTHQTELVSLLAELDGVAGRDAFARHAATARDEAACRLHVETAQLIWTYHRSRRPVASLRVEGGVVSLEDVDGRRALPLAADYVFWTPRVEPLLDALPPTGGRSVWLSGKLSPRSRRELEQRGIAVHERVLAAHPAEVDVAAVLVPARAETDGPGGESD